MSRADYAHWNEDADYMWWHEEGKHADEPPEPDEYDPADDWRDVVNEHEDRSDCLYDGDMSLPSKTGIWECDHCLEQFPEKVAL